MNLAHVLDEQGRFAEGTEMIDVSEDLGAANAGIRGKLTRLGAGG